MTDEEKIRIHLTGGMVGVFFHELGHGMINIFKLPITGREEDVVDEFSTMLLLFAREEGADFVPELVYGFAGFFYRMSKHADETPYWDEHTDPMVRFGNILCLLYGSSPDEFQKLVETHDMPERRQHFCVQDYKRRSEAWEKILAPYLKENGAQGTGRLYVEYGETKSEFGKKMEASLKEERIFESLAEGINQAIAFPYDIKIVPQDCGTPNAFWDPENRQIVMCHELTQFNLQLMLQEDDGNKPPKPDVVGQWGFAIQNQGVRYVFKMAMDQKGQYYWIHEQWRGRHALLLGGRSGEICRSKRHDQLHDRKKK